MFDLVVDLSSNNAVFDFPLANSQGCRSAYVKVGGDNIPRYFSPSYTPRADSGHLLGWPLGSYWITGGHDPASAAAFFVAHLRSYRMPDYVVLDNEKLDDGNVYTDAEAAAWVNEVVALGIPASRVLHYGSKSFMESHAWPQLLATGCSFIIADYNGTPLVNHIPSTIPASRVVGHQYADNGNVGGAHPVDLNAFVPGFLTSTATASTGAQGDEFDMASIADLQTVVGSAAADIKSAIRREARARLYYCATPPAGLPNFVAIFWERDPAEGKNILYGNAGELQVRHWLEVYYQTSDTVEQAKAAPVTPEAFQALVNFALGKDSAFTNALAPAAK